MSYIIAEVNLNDKQKKQVIKSISSQVPTKLRLSKTQVKSDGNELLALTGMQLKQYVKAYEQGTGLTLNLSKTQLEFHRKAGLLNKLVTGEGFFSDVWNVAKKVGGVVADKVLLPAGHMALKLARDIGGKKIGKAVEGVCDTLATTALIADNPELIPLASAGCSELGGVVKDKISGNGMCGCEMEKKPKKGKGGHDKPKPKKAKK